MAGILGAIGQVVDADDLKIIGVAFVVVVALGVALVILAAFAGLAAGLFGVLSGL